MDPFKLMGSGHAAGVFEDAEFSGASANAEHTFQDAVFAVVEPYSGNELWDAVQPFLIYKTPEPRAETAGTSTAPRLSESILRQEIEDLKKKIAKNQSELRGLIYSYKVAVGERKDKIANERVDKKLLIVQYLWQLKDLEKSLESFKSN